MMDILIRILVNAILLFLVGRLVSGVEVRDGKAAIFGAIAFVYVFLIGRRLVDSVCGFGAVYLVFRIWCLV